MEVFISNEHEETLGDNKYIHPFDRSDDHILCIHMLKSSNCMLNL